MADGVGYNKINSYSVDINDPDRVYFNFNATFGEIFIDAYYYDVTGLYVSLDPISPQNIYSNTSGGADYNIRCYISRQALFGDIGGNSGVFVMLRIHMRKWFLFNNYYQAMTYGWYIPPYGYTSTIPKYDGFRFNSTTSSIYYEEVNTGDVIDSNWYSTSSGVLIPRDSYLYNHVVCDEVANSGYQI